MISKKASISIKIHDINDIGIIEFTCNDDITFSISDQLGYLKKFIFIDEVTFKTVCAGKINFALRKSGNLFKTENIVSKKLEDMSKDKNPNVYG